MDVPSEYRGREQSYLKHRVLTEYLRLWSHKLGSLARNRAIKLWYVDCFSGPWQQHDQELQDTSIYIGLKCLEEAGRTWQQHGYQIELGAIFVEKNAHAFQRLEQYLRDRDGTVAATPLRGEFGERVPDIAQRIGTDPAFIFIDPTGFKGVAMRYIEPLVQPRMRDVLVNVMFNHINRFKDVEIAFLREQMCEFFGLGDQTLPPGLNEPELLRLYRQKLKENCKIKYAADLAVPHPTRERTWFRLVIGGKHKEVLRVFRDVERRVMGEQAARVRADAKQRHREDRSKQLAFPDSGPSQDPWYLQQNSYDRELIIDRVVAQLSSVGGVTFDSLWPDLLEEHHVTYEELAALIWQAAEEGRLRIASDRPRPRTVRGLDRLSLPPAAR